MNVKQNAGEKTTIFLIEFKVGTHVYQDVECETVPSGVDIALVVTATRFHYVIGQQD